MEKQQEPTLRLASVTPLADGRYALVIMNEEDLRVVDILVKVSRLQAAALCWELLDLFPDGLSRDEETGEVTPEEGDEGVPGAAMFFPGEIEINPMAFGRLSL